VESVSDLESVSKPFYIFKVVGLCGKLSLKVAGKFRFSGMLICIKKVFCVRAYMNSDMLCDLFYVSKSTPLVRVHEKHCWAMIRELCLRSWISRLG
jgi:hypothetical protein